MLSMNLVGSCNCTSLPIRDCHTVTKIRSRLWLEMRPSPVRRFEQLAASLPGIGATSSQRAPTSSSSAVMAVVGPGDARPSSSVGASDALSWRHRGVGGLRGRHSITDNASARNVRKMLGKSTSNAPGSPGSPVLLLCRCQNRLPVLTKRAR